MVSTSTVRILGIDPGSRITGYGIITCTGQNHQATTYGTIQTARAHQASDKLEIIHTELKRIIHAYAPDTAAIEQVFMHRNAQSALTLGQARGVAMVTAAICGLSVSEYSAKQIKSAVVGYGAAGKSQVQHMVTLLLKLSEHPAEDAADALAVALCHGHTQQYEKRLRSTHTTDD